MTDFEMKVLQELGEIKASIATTAQAQTDQDRRITELHEYNKTQDSRAWVKSMLVGVTVLVGHPIARRLGLDI